MSKGFDIEDKIDAIKEKGVMFHEGIRLNCRLTSYSHYEAEHTIKLCFVSGYGLNEEKHESEFAESELDAELALFVPIKKVESKFIKDPKSEVSKQGEKIIPKKPKEPLEMSENTENNLSGLRKHLFEAIRKLEGGTMKADDAKAMAGLAQTIINSAKLEMEFKMLISEKPDIKMIN